MTFVTSGNSDPELTDWLLTIINGDLERGIAPAGDFLNFLAKAALRADYENYPLLRPALLEIKKRYPKYG